VVARYYADKLSSSRAEAGHCREQAGHDPVARADPVAKAPPDGYTILITSVTSSHAANVFNFKKLPYDPIQGLHAGRHAAEELFHSDDPRQRAVVSVAALTEAMKIKGDRASYGYGAPPPWPPRSFTRRARPASRRHSVQKLRGLAAGDVQR